MIIDFRRKSSKSPSQTFIKGTGIEFVEQYKYPGTIIDSDLKFDANSDAICKKGQQCLYFLRKLNVFNVDKTMMCLFYKSFIESVFTFSIIAWYGNLNFRGKNHQNNIVKVAGKVIGIAQTPLTAIFEQHVIHKSRSILAW